jgi:hypothetical protein
LKALQTIWFVSKPDEHGSPIRLGAMDPVRDSAQSSPSSDFDRSHTSCSGLPGTTIVVVEQKP